MLAFVVVMFTVAVVIAAKIPHNITTVGAAPSVFQSAMDLQHCQLLANAVTHAWVIPYIGLMVFPSYSAGLDLVQGPTIP